MKLSTRFHIQVFRAIFSRGINYSTPWWTVITQHNPRSEFMWYYVVRGWSTILTIFDDTINHREDEIDAKWSPVIDSGVLHLRWKIFSLPPCKGLPRVCRKIDGNDLYSGRWYFNQKGSETNSFPCSFFRPPVIRFVASEKGNLVGVRPTDRLGILMQLEQVVLCVTAKGSQLMRRVFQFPFPATGTSFSTTRTLATSYS